MDDPKHTRLAAISKLIIFLLWAGTFTVALAWLLNWDVPFDPEPVTVLLGLLSVAFTGIINSYLNLLRERQQELDQEMYSTSYALAYGYVNNFLEPAITQLLSDRETDDLEFFIYIPGQLAELYPHAIERTIAKIKTRNYSCSLVSLSDRENRARDVMTVFKEQAGEIKYFDFPTTLLTLVSLVDYKIDSHKDSFSEREKLALGKSYIDRFRSELEKMTISKQIDSYIKYTDTQLNFVDDA